MCLTHGISFTTSKLGLMASATERRLTSIQEGGVRLVSQLRISLLELVLHSICPPFTKMDRHYKVLVWVKHEEIACGVNIYKKVKRWNSNFLKISSCICFSVRLHDQAYYHNQQRVLEQPRPRWTYGRKDDNSYSRDLNAHRSDAQMLVIYLLIYSFPYQSKVTRMHGFF